MCLHEELPIRRVIMCICWIKVILIKLYARGQAGLEMNTTVDGSPTSESRLETEVRV